MRSQSYLYPYPPLSVSTILTCCTPYGIFQQRCGNIYRIYFLRTPITNKMNHELFLIIPLLSQWSINMSSTISYGVGSHMFNIQHWRACWNHASSYPIQPYSIYIYSPPYIILSQFGLIPPPMRLRLRCHFPHSTSATILDKYEQYELSKGWPLMIVSGNIIIGLIGTSTKVIQRKTVYWNAELEGAGLGAKVLLEEVGEK